ncbi:MAG: pyridoxal-phosphate dependent enzyme [Sphingobacteriales bacterium]|nr:pyridoxal-phosphate dependent enzyme [Sphingobacteriales bacterium]
MKSNNLCAKMVFDKSNIKNEYLKNALFDKKGLTLSVLRLDKIHPIISGNKLYKLSYFLQLAENTPYKAVITFGGAYSNHLVATAYACKLSGLKSIGIVRGEEAKQLSHTLQYCRQYGMKLKFISRQEYDKKEQAGFQQSLFNELGDALIIPEGGYHPTGAKGAALIMDNIDEDVTYICSALGTATTVAGLLLGTKVHQQIVAVPVLKGLQDIDTRIAFLTNNQPVLGTMTVLQDHHFGGYAKYTAELTAFMNTIYTQYQLATDFVYTAKMLFAIYAAAEKDMFPPGSKIVCLHTGGLQGNASLPPNTLIFD